MEFESSTLLWIGGGIIIVAIGVYLTNRENPKTVFLKNKTAFEKLINDLPNGFNVNSWTIAIVTVNNKTLTGWWQNLLKNNKNDTERVRKALCDTLEDWGVNISVSPQPDTAVKVNPILAKRAFIENLDRFSSIFNTLSEQNFNLQAWTERIIDVNDPNLTALWKRYVESGDVVRKWRQLLSSWQIKSDTCKSFTCATADNIAAYRLPDGSDITKGVKYKVEEPCWIFTSEDADGKLSKRVINKGIVIPVQP